MKKRSLRRLRKKTTVSLVRLARKYRLEKYALSLVCAAIMLAVFNSGLLDRFELTLLDYRFKIRPPQAPSNDIILIDIAEDSIERIGRWPWDRTWHATLLDALKSYGVKSIIYDVIFSEPSNPEQDHVLKTALANAGNVYLPYAFGLEERDSRYFMSQESISYLPLFRDTIKGDGFINIMPDPDGVLRRAPLIIEYGKDRSFQIAFSAACDSLGVDKKNIVAKKGEFIRLPIPAKNSYIDIPIDDKYQMLLNWPGGWKKGFKHFSFYDIISSFTEIKKGEKPDIRPEALKDKICIVGMAVSGLLDIKPTPIEPLYPAMGVNAVIIDNIIRQDFLDEVSKNAVASLIIIIALITAGAVSIYHPLRDFLSSVILMAIYTAGALLSFIYLNLWVNAIYPASTILFTYIGLTLYNEIQINLEKKSLFRLATTDRLTNLFQKEHFNTLIRTKLAERRRDKQSDSLSIIMADVDFFKKINDTYGHLFGDMVLKKVAHTIKMASRPMDVCARYGGEEFIIMLPNTTLPEATAIAERIRQAVERKNFRYNKQSCKVTVSLGVATLKRESSEELLIQKADNALYEAKRGGRNRVCKG